MSLQGLPVKEKNEYGKLITDGTYMPSALMTDLNGGCSKPIRKKLSLSSIIEHKEASEEQKKITLCNSGIMAFDLAYAEKLIDKIDNKNSKKEYYLTDAVEIANQEKLQTSFITVDIGEVQGINNKIELSLAENYYQDILRNKAMSDGVTIIDPKSVFLSEDSTFGKDVIIEPSVIIRGNVTIGDNVQIRAFSYLENCKIGDQSIIGPYARIRPNTEIKEGAKVGNFVEIKNSHDSKRSKNKPFKLYWR